MDGYRKSIRAALDGGYTTRNEAIRIISVRRSRDNEVKDYDSQKGD